ncbi:MAG: sugar MFS transporter [Lentisphaerae bacterium]|nr:sugar MFS transporter [Lentisphaerota bacterium]MCP4101248.1 sugar MFS transporter [Lentisphaerota bacterium]
MSLSIKSRTLPIFLAFLCMGFGDAVGPFVGLAKEEFHLSNFSASLIAFAGFIMFGLLSVPIGLLQDRKSKKSTLMLGLIIASIGMFIPFILGLKSFPLFLVTILLLGAGATIMQVAGNPIMRDVSKQGKFSRDLSMAQFVKAIGSMTGPLIPAIAARFFGAGWDVVFPIFAISLFITVILVSMLDVKEQKAEQKPASLKSCFSLLANPFALIMVTGIFLYVGAEVCISSGVPMYLKSEFGVNLRQTGIMGAGLFFLSLTIGRFAGGIILNWLNPKKALLGSCILAVVPMIVLLSCDKIVAIICIFVAGLGCANIFPLIFSITLDKMPNRANELSGLMVTAIVGGAFIPPVMGFVADMTSVPTSFLVPTIALLYILTVAISVLVCHKKRVASNIESEPAI